MKKALVGFLLTLVAVVALQPGLTHAAVTIDASFPGGCLAVGDFNSDGRQDIAFATGAELGWYENNANGSFTKHVVDLNNHSALVVADINNDGKKDLVVAISPVGSASSISWYSNDGVGNFTKNIISAASESWAVDVFDVDNDGRLDIVGASKWVYSIILFRQQANGSFVQQQISTDLARSFAHCDVNNDGKMDLLAAIYWPGGAVWYENNGIGNFTRHELQSFAYAHNIDCLDANGDGKNDIIAGNNTVNQTIFINNGSQSFTAYNILPSGYWMAYPMPKGEFSTAPGDEFLLLQGSSLTWNSFNNGSITTQTIDSSAPTNALVADIDGDGRSEIVVAGSAGLNLVPEVDGSCGSSHGQTFQSAPFASLCGDSSTPGLTATANGWDWSCSGKYGGNSASCSATNNTMPVANAGPDQSVARGSIVTLNGGGSVDADIGDQLTYSWSLTTKPGGSTVALSSTTVVGPTFMPDLAGIYVATLVVNDGKVSSTADTVAITVNKTILAITAAAQSKAYGAADPALTWSATGYVNGDTATAITGSLTRAVGENAGNYAINQGTLAAANYTISYTGASLTINKATLTITADAKSKAYSTANPVLSATTSGLVNGDTAGVISGTPGLSTTATTASGAGSYPITVTSGTLAATNYNFTYVNGTLTITKAALAVTAAAQSKSYGSVDPALTWSATGYVNGDTATALTGTLARLAGENVGTYAINQGSLAAANYTISYTGSSLTINKATLTITADAKSKAYSTANPVLSATTSGLVNGDTAAVISGTPSLSTTATTASGVGIYPITVTAGTLAAINYNFAYVNGTITITKAALAITAASQSKSYGAVDPAMTWSATGYVNGDTATAVTGSLTRATGENVGTYAINQGSLAAANYTISYTGANLTINKAPLAITAAAKSKTCGAIDPALTWSATGYVNGDTATAVSGTLTRAAGENVGTYAINQGSLAAANYTINYTGAILTISKATLVVTAAAKSKSYGAVDPVLTWSATGYVNGDTATAVTGTLARVAGENAGSYAINQGSLAAANYTISYTGASLTINKVPLTITAAAQSKSYSAVDPALTWSATGYVNGDTATAVTGSLTRVAGETAGTYAISQGSLAAANYSISYTGAILTINKVSLTITAAAKSKTYGAADPALTWSATGYVNGDTATAVTGSLARVAGENVGTYAINQGGLVAANYTLSFTGANFTINKAPLAVTAAAKSKTYGAVDPALTWSATGYVNGDTATAVTGSLARVAGENVGAYAINQGSLAAANYTISYTGASLTINKPPLTITVDAKSKTYGAVDPALTWSATGYVNGDTATAVTGSLTRAGGENVGAYAITQGSLGAANYTINYTGANLTINKAALAVTAAAKSKSYGAVDPAFTWIATGYVNGDTATAVTGTLARAGGENVGTYAINQGSLAAANYTISYTGDNLIINKVPLAITAAAKSKSYSAVDPLLTWSATGYVNGDTATAVSGTLSRIAGESVGTYAINQGTLAAANYTISYTGASLTINKAVLAVTAAAQSKSYSAVDPALTWSATGYVNGDTATAVTGALARAAGENAGTYAINQGSLAAANYTISYTGANLTINKVPLTITAAAQSKSYGAVDPALTWSATGYVNGDTATAVTGNLLRAVGADAGTYTINQGTLAAANYSISYTGANLTINKVPLNITAAAQSKTYGAADPALTWTATGYVNGDTSSAVAGSLSRAAGVDAGTYAITQGTLTAVNYTISYTGANLTINKATLTITADAKSKAYSTANPVFSATTSGLVNGDTVSVISGTPGFSTTATTASGVGSYPITVTAGTLASINYNFTYVNGTLTITKAALAVTADAQSKSYGAVDPALTWSATGYVNGDTSSAVTGGLSRAPGTNAGTYVINQGTLAAANYTISYTGASLTINKVPLTITAAAKSKTYGAADPPLTWSATGYVNG
ncbi:MAG: hypothetical protein HGA96_14715, partial [Desulfobulbaceae bacterium]|nr:hypothetical protein [Desulfobulbaceae bacterium]